MLAMAKESSTSTRRWLLALVVAFLSGYYTHYTRTAPVTQAGRPQVAFVAGGSNAFWGKATEGARDAGKQFDADVKIYIPEKGLPEQNQILASLPVNQISGVSISPMSPDEQSVVLGRIADRINLITHDSDAPQSGRLCYIGTNNLRAGGLCAELVKEAIPEGGKVAIFVGSIQKNNAQMRCLGLIEELLDVRIDIDESKLAEELSQDHSNEKYTVLAPQLDFQDPEKAKANALATIKEHPDIACMVGLFSRNGPKCLQAIEELGKGGEIQVVAFDTHDETIQGIEDGKIYGTVMQDPYGYGFESVRLLVDYQQRKTRELPFAGGGSVTLDCRRLTKANLEEYRAKLAKTADAETAKKK